MANSSICVHALHRSLLLGHGLGQRLGRKGTTCATVNPEVVTSPCGNNPDGRFAALTFIEEVRKKGVTLKQLKAIAPQFQQEHVQFLNKVAEEKDALRQEQVELMREIVDTNKELDQVKRDAAEQLRITAQMVQNLEEMYANLGLRLVVETSMRNFLSMHLEGQCADPLCLNFLTSWEQQGIIRKKRTVTLRPAPTSATPPPSPTATTQAYILSTQNWKRPEVIQHYAECPRAKLVTKYEEGPGNVIVSMKEADLRLDLASRAQVVWGDLHAPHHILDTSEDAPYLKLPYGPKSNRTDTLFYLSAAEGAKVDMRLILEEEAVQTDVASELRKFAAQFMQ